MHTKKKIIKDGLRDSIIQRFEFVTELSWKLMKRYLDENIEEVYLFGSRARSDFKERCNLKIKKRIRRNKMHSHIWCC